MRYTNLRQYRTHSTLFVCSSNNTFGLIPGVTESVTDGFWIILQPLSVGKHDIYFSGSADFTSSGVQKFVQQPHIILEYSKYWDSRSVGIEWLSHL